MGIKWRDKRGKSKRKIQGFSFPFSISIRIEPARLNVVHGGVDLEISDNSDDGGKSTLSLTPCPASSSSDKTVYCYQTIPIGMTKIVIQYEKWWSNLTYWTVDIISIKVQGIPYIYIYISFWFSISKLRAILRWYFRPTF